MLGRNYETQICSIARSLEVVGERWSLLIIRDALFAGVTRFTDFQHNLGIATNVLAARLEGLVGAGVMERQSHSAESEVFEYVLTEKGRELAPALVALTEWGDRWAAPDGPPILYRHSVCGGEVMTQTACADCGVVGPGEVQVQPGPGMPAEYLARRRGSRSR